MQEIEVGKYVRTKNQGIKKIDIIFKNKTINKYGYKIIDNDGDKAYKIIKTTDIIEHSNNVLDLIKIDDIVEVLDIDWVRVFKLDNKEEIEIFREEIQENNYKLLSIETKEQFEQKKYRLED